MDIEKNYHGLCCILSNVRQPRFVPEGGSGGDGGDPVKQLRSPKFIINPKSAVSRRAAKQFKSNWTVATTAHRRRRSFP